MEYEKLGVVGTLVILVASLCLGSLALAQEHLLVFLSQLSPLPGLLFEEALKKSNPDRGNQDIFGSRG